MKEENSWIYELEKNIPRFVSTITDDFHTFKYSVTGDLNKNYNTWGLANIVFVTKILYIVNKIDAISDKQKLALYNGIMKYYSYENYFIDPYITKYPMKIWIKKMLNKSLSTHLKFINNTHRAETRQAFAAITLLGKIPPRPYLKIPTTDYEIIKFLENFNWKRPWDAGSHFSHLLFFLEYNFKNFNINNKTLIETAINWINLIQSKEDGCWYSGDDINLKEKINGAMKILTGLHAAGIYDFPYPKKLIDTALLGSNNKEACSNFNIVYVLYGASLLESEYRKFEIEDFLMNRLKLYKEYYWPQYGGFSFFKKSANSVFYGKNITAGLSEPDVHGTIMFIWGLSIINKMINLNLDWKIPLN